MGQKNGLKPRKTGQEILETEHRDKEGNIYPVEVTNNFIEHDGKEYFCSSVRDIRKRKREEEILKSISENTSGVTGTDYFRELAKYITATLNVGIPWSCSVRKTISPNSGCFPMLTGKKCWTILITIPMEHPAKS